MSIDGEAFVSQEFKTPLAGLTVVFFVVSTIIICFCCYCTDSIVNAIKGFFGSRRHHHYPPKSPVYMQIRTNFTPDRPDLDSDSIRSSEASMKQKMHSKIFRYGSCPPEYQKFPAISKYKEDFDDTPGCYISAV